MKIKSAKRLCLFLLLIAFGVSSCVQSDQGMPTLTEQSVQMTDTLVLTPTRQSGTMTATATVTNTLSPTATNTLEPGLSYDEAVESISSLLATNGDCTLPCWIGFTPGVSTRDDINNFIHNYQSIIGGSRIYEEEQKILVKISPLTKWRYFANNIWAGRSSGNCSKLLYTNDHVSW
jgi:hypothetical protein